VLTVLSLLLSVAGAAVWARSYVVADDVTITSGRRQADLFSDAGSYVAPTVTHSVDYGHGWAWTVDSPVFTRESVLRALARFQGARHTVDGKTIGHYVVVPQWTVPAVFGVLPAVRFLRWRRRRLARHRGFDVEPVTRATLPAACSTS
jgi:hypothetical protein